MSEKSSARTDRRKAKAPDKRAVAARQNGARGGRPPSWSPVVLEAAAKCLRREAGRLTPVLAKELLRFAQAIEDSNLRLHPRKARDGVKGNAGRVRHMRVIVTMRITGGRSNRGVTNASIEIAEQVLARYQARFLEAWDYEAVIPYRTDDELDRILSQAIPAQAWPIARKRHCGIEYHAKSVEDARSWNDATKRALGYGS
jgi:hypothetical protein